MDKISLHGLRIHAFHGVLRQERTVGNDFEVDLVLKLDASEAMLSDRLFKSINYADLATLVSEEMAIPADLLEGVAGRIRRRIIRKFPHSRGGCLTISKLAPPLPYQVQKVSFTTEW